MLRIFLIFEKLIDIFNNCDLRVWGEATNFKEYFEAYLLGSAYWRKTGRKLSERATGLKPIDWL
ncbi:hypothetical protein COX74_00390 [bacterium (Candidatus Gribaldobacteria) CG_4_10_14_0_2_um_filter_41_16]|uniref:Uncharacterized protein n=1 Tax=bacterium (Candidatus Gribaldobacteria) CG_4_10_14_0_2_um_filter_41_16 TaxID=2014265 RepID=A0A2M7VJ92_9BACT|nr:MAG: hypothetical protein AUJ36_02060 [Parcubacteria group bacterium CG1_02_41_26]PJA01884.1 MAG: hypothetical protein COX74_00390 [bacterium (Candidatus Gribaldobacteria) CG_4_10_14_0_2_um_filter_41_16]